LFEQKELFYRHVGRALVKVVLDCLWEREPVSTRVALDRAVIPKGAQLSARQVTALHEALGCCIRCEWNGGESDLSLPGPSGMPRFYPDLVTAIGDLYDRLDGVFAAEH